MRPTLLVALLGLSLAPGLLWADCMDSVWVIGPGSLNSDVGTGITWAADGNVMIGGYYDFTGTTQGYGWLIKLNPADGQQIWSRTYSVAGAQSIFLDVSQVDDGGFICGGWYREPTTLDQQFWLHRVDANGDSLWSRTYGHEFVNQGRAVIQTADSGFAIAGRGHTLPGGFGQTDWSIVKTNANGDSLWSQIIGGPLEDTCLEMILTPTGNYLLIGYSETDTTREGRVAEISTTGQILWNRAYSPDVSVVLEGVVRTPEGYALCGSVMPPNGTNDVLLMEIDVQGNELWHRIIDLLPGRNDVAMAIHNDGYGGFFMCGHGYRNSTTEKDVFVLHVLACGDTVRTRWVGNAVDEEVSDGVSAPNGMFVTSGFARLPDNQSELQAYGFSADTCNTPPCSFERVSPGDSTLVPTTHLLQFTWTRSSDPDGDPLSYVFHVESNYAFPLEPADTVTSDTFVLVLIPIPVRPLDEIFDFRWRVWATDGQDTVEATDSEGYFRMDIPTTADESVVLPASFRFSAFPNPFNAATRLSLVLTHSEHVRLTLYDLHGRHVTSLTNGPMTAGAHEIVFDASALPSGIYFAALSTPTYSGVTKLMLLK